MTFSEQVREVAAENERLHPRDEGFLDQLKQASERLDQFDDERELVLHKQLSPDKLGDDRNEVFLNLLRNQRGWLDFFIHTHVYKVKQLVRRLEEDLNANKYLTAASASRAIVEHTASLNYYLEKHISPLFEKLQNIDPEANFPAFVQNTVELIRGLMKYAKATRFNWKSLVEGNLEKFYESWDEVDESIEQVNILTMVDKLPQDERGARFFYEMLSDFLHPNVGSHLLFVDDVSHSEDTVKYTLRSEPRNDELLLAFLHVVSIPVKTSLPLFVDLVGGLSDNLRELENTLDRMERRSRSI